VYKDKMKEKQYDSKGRAENKKQTERRKGREG
jgi:hypothetical protein